MAVRAHLWQGEGDGFLPGVFSLSDGPITRVESSVADPKVAMDATGFWITDGAGNKIVQVTSNGLQIPSGSHDDVFPGPIANKVRWLNSGGSLVAELYGYNLDGPNIGDFVARAQSRNGPAQVRLTTRDETTGLLTELHTWHDPTGASPARKIEGFVDGEGAVGRQTVTIIDSLGNSDFVRKSTVPVYNLASTGATGALGSAFQTVPGLQQANIQLTPANMVLLFASVRVNVSGVNSHQVFWTGNNPGFINLTATQAQTTNTDNVSTFAAYRPTVTGPHTFQVQAACPGGGGTAGGAGSHAIIVVL